MDSTLAIDYWIAVCRKSIFTRLPRINERFTELHERWLGGTLITDPLTAEKEALLANLSRFSNLRYLRATIDGSLPLQITELPCTLFYAYLSFTSVQGFSRHLPHWPPYLRYLHYFPFVYDEDLIIGVTLTREPFPESLHTLITYDQVLKAGPCPPQLVVLSLEPVTCQSVITTSALPSTLQVLQAERGVHITFDAPLPNLQILLAGDCVVNSWLDLPDSLQLANFKLTHQSGYQPCFAHLPRSLRLLACKNKRAYCDDLRELPPALRYACGRIRLAYGTQKDAASIIVLAAQPYFELHRQLTIPMSPILSTDVEIVDLTTENCRTLGELCDKYRV